jgi:quercetin dioxygenase-like cupin family protein
MRVAACTVLFAVMVAGPALRSVSAEDKAVYAARATTKFTNFPGLPACMLGSAQNGDPSKGASVILAKTSAGCLVPWHWHTPTEQLMLVSGSMKVEMKDGSPVTLHAGDYLSLPSKHVHQAICPVACTLFVSSDKAFDIHYVDKDGKEISAEEALKSKAKAPSKNPAAKKEMKM